MAKHKKRGRGRPHTNPSLKEYTLKTVLHKFMASQSQLFHAYAGDALWLDDDTALKVKQVIKNDKITCKFRIQGRGSNYRVGFSDGMKFATEVFERSLVPRIVSEMIENDGLTLNASMEAIRREAQKQQKPTGGLWGKAGQMLEEHMKKQHPVPSDIARKVRRPAVSREEILRFTRTIKGMDGPAYPEDLAEKLNITVEQVQELHRQALKQRFLVRTGKDRKGREFLLM